MGGIKPSARNLDALKRWIRRHRSLALIGAGVLLIAVAAGLGVAYGFAVATFAVVVYTAVFAAVTMLGWTPLRPVPELEVGLWHGGQLVRTFTVAPDRPRRPIDIDACIRNAVRDVRGQVPADPEEAVKNLE